MADTRKDPDALITTVLLGAIALGLILIIFGGGGLWELNTDSKSYEKDWEKVAEFESQSWYQSADRVVTKIQNRAKRNKNGFQEAKAIIAHMRLQPHLGVDWEVNVEREWREAIPRWEFPYGQLGHSVLGQFYWDYARKNLWRLEGVAEVPEDTADFRSWGIQRLAQEADRHFRASLAAQDSLGKVGLKAFTSLLLCWHEGAEYRPSLLDLLAWRALEFYESPEANATQARPATIGPAKSAFGSAATFLKTKFTTTDTTNFRFQALHIYQLLTQRHIKDRLPEAQVLIDIERMKSAQTIFPSLEGDSLRIGLLATRMEELKGYDAEAYCAAEIAKIYLGHSDTLAMPGSSPKLNNTQRALQVLDNAILHLESELPSHKLCMNMAKTIRQKSLTVNLKDNLLPGRPSLISIGYKNIDSVWFKVVKVDSAFQDRFWRNDKQEKETLLALPAEMEWMVNLPDASDCIMHWVLSTMPPMAQGNYVLFAGTDPYFANATEYGEYGYFRVNQLGLWTSAPDTNELEGFVLDRRSGKPISGAGVKLWKFKTQEGQDTRMMEFGNVVTDAGGYFHLNNVGHSSEYTARVVHGKDTLRLEDDPPYLRPDDWDRQETNIHLFTDRAIYRPQQEVFFKGIVMVEGGGKPEKLLTNSKRKVFLQDANSVKVDSMSLTTNDFGSYAGSFRLPSGKLNGWYSIWDGESTSHFSVEEYKRPQFEVELDTIQGSHRVGEMIVVHGRGKTYAGANLTDAKVTFSVVRTVYFPWRYCFWGGYDGGLPDWGQRVDIAQGALTPDSLGDFHVRFKAMPDPEQDFRRQPTFEYTVNVTVTDATGESHASSITTKVGYRTLGLDLELPSQIDQDAFKGSKVSTKSLNDQHVPTKGVVKVYQLQGPTQAWIPLNFMMPDKFLMGQDSFRRLFPHVPYSKSDRDGESKRIKTVAEVSFDTQTADEIQFPGIERWEQGWYEFEGKCKDAFGQEVNFLRRILVYSSKSDSIPTASPLWVADFQSAYEPGQVAVLDIATSFAEGYAFYELSRGSTLIDRRWIPISSKRTKIRIPIQESFRGGLTVSIHLLHDGEEISQTRRIEVPWTNKELKIELATFRDKLAPGAKEEWLLKILGDKGQQVAAELLATMYDASLDDFTSHGYALFLPSTRPVSGSRYWETESSRQIAVNEFQYQGNDENRISEFYLRYDALHLPSMTHFTANLLHGRWVDWVPMLGSDRTMSAWGIDEFVRKGEPFNVQISEGYLSSPAPSTTYYANSRDEVSIPKEFDRRSKVTANAVSLADEPMIAPPSAARIGKVKTRKNLQETAFFYPQLRTDASGNVILRFTMPEALTRWKLLSLAHTRDLRIGTKTAEVVTQKDLMIQPNAPRFFREDDRIHYTARITNLSGNDLSGFAQLELLDAKTDRPIDSLLGNAKPIIPFSLKAGQTKGVSWALRIPRGIEAVTHRVKAVADKFSDGEESTIPVLPNAMLITEALPMPLRPKQSRTFEFKRLLTANSPTMRHHRYTIEFTSNPAWYAVQSLPYLMEFPYECVEQTFSRYYANALASHIVNRHPRIKAVFEKWKSLGKDVAISRLARNPELKSVLIEETPWLMEGKSEEDRLRNLGLLFDLQRMAEAKENIKRSLIKAQSNSGAFSWFQGMPDNPYITRHIMSGFGHLMHLGEDDIRTDPGLMRMITKAVHYCDTEMASQYAKLKKIKNVNLANQHIGWSEIHYLYGRSFFPDIEYAPGCKDGMQYYLGQAKQHWKSLDLYAQGMAALALHRSGDKTTPQAIMASIKDRALHSDEMGMYWAQNEWYLWWYESPIETHALLIEAFHEVTRDHESVEEMKLWLLKQKESRDWGTTRATVEACNALLNLGTDLLAESRMPSISVGGTILNATNSPEVKVQAGTGYMKKTYQGSEVRPALGKVQVSNPNNVVAWGGLYWQYFEQMDKVTSAKGKCSIEKELLVESGGNTYRKYEPSKHKLHPGDKIRVRLKVTADRALQYVHVKDLRASGMEPKDVLSGYSYEGGLSLYNTTRDASTNFFIEDFPAGIHILEYDLKAVHVGDFASGAATMQCMYAPEFAAHTSGTRVSIGN